MLCNQTLWTHHVLHHPWRLSLPLCRGLYLASIFYKDENVLVTSEDQLPVVEVDDSYSCHAQDLLWFTKVTKCIGGDAQNQIILLKCLEIIKVFVKVLFWWGDLLVVKFSFCFLIVYMRLQFKEYDDLTCIENKNKFHNSSIPIDSSFISPSSQV